MINIKNLKLNFLIQTIIVFLFMSFLSLVTANTMITGKVVYTSEPVHSVYISPTVSAPPYEPAGIDAFQFLVAFFIATSLMLIFLKLCKGKFLFEFFFAGAVIFGAQGPLGILFEKTSAFFIAVTIVVLRFAYPRIWTQNLAIILGIAGIAASLGMSVEPLMALLILVLLSIYDIIAVYKTRHMVKLFKGMAKKGAVLALILPKNFSKWFGKFKIIEPKNENEFVFLGTGDLALPLFFAVSAFSLGVEFSLAIIAGAIIGFAVDHLIFMTQKKKNPIPALPAVAFFSIMGYLVKFYLW